MFLLNSFSSLVIFPVSVFFMLGWGSLMKEFSPFDGVFSPLPKTGSYSPLITVSDTTRDWYHYRIISRYYDSSQLNCMYGEICVFNNSTGDSYRVPFKGWFPSPIDTTLGRVNELARSRSFLVGTFTDLTFYRFMSLNYGNIGQCNLDITDTTIWVAELCRSQNNSKITTLDSMVIFPKRTGIEIPPRYPEAESYATISCNLSSFNFNETDSAYLRFTLKVLGESSENSGFAIRDILTAHHKLSDSLILPLRSICGRTPQIIR